MILSFRSQWNPNLKILIIFDSIMLEKQIKVKRLWNTNIDCFYISQNYIKLPFKLP